jgi:biopolymer transport protein ExbD/biopolymer transport protein TolR
MHLGNAGKMNSAINVTPLVDVVLVLLIIFMVMAPQMKKGPQVNLPETAKPGESGDDQSPIQITIDEHGGLWIEDQAVAPESFGESLRAVPGAKPETQVVVSGDARLHFGEIRAAMMAVEEAGFHGVRLIADRAGSKPKGN